LAALLEGFLLFEIPAIVHCRRCGGCSGGGGVRAFCEPCLCISAIFFVGCAFCQMTLAFSFLSSSTAAVHLVRETHALEGSLTKLLAILNRELLKDTILSALGLFTAHLLTSH
jgi:hypothetical protein